MEHKKYKLTDETIEVEGKILYRIEALKDFGKIKNGDNGGFIESENNLSHEGDAWVSDDACVSDNARVCGNARVYGDALVRGDACVCGDAEISTDADYIVFKNWWSSGRYFTWTRSNNMWSVGCFYGTGDELVKKAYKDSSKSGRQYERLVKYVEETLKEEENGGQ